MQLEGESGPLPQLIHPLEILVGTRSLVTQEILKGQRVGLSGTVEILIRFGPLPGANLIHLVNTLCQQSPPISQEGVYDRLLKKIGNLVL